MNCSFFKRLSEIWVWQIVTSTALIPWPAPHQERSGVKRYISSTWSHEAYGLWAGLHADDRYGTSCHPDVTFSFSPPQRFQVVVVWLISGWLQRLCLFWLDRRGFEIYTLQVYSMKNDDLLLFLKSIIESPLHFTSWVSSIPWI